MKIKKYSVKYGERERERMCVNLGQLWRRRLVLYPDQRGRWCRRAQGDGPGSPCHCTDLTRPERWDDVIWLVVTNSPSCLTHPKNAGVIKVLLFLLPQVLLKVMLAVHCLVTDWLGGPSDYWDLSTLHTCWHQPESCQPLSPLPHPSHLTSPPLLSIEKCSSTSISSVRRICWRIWYFNDPET